MAHLVPKIYPQDVNTDIPIGLGFPLSLSNQKTNYLTVNQVHDNLRNLILTMKGERPMLPTFGSDLYNLLFEPMDDERLTQACTRAIEEACAIWLPHVKIMDTDVTSLTEVNKVNIAVQYSVDGWVTENILNLTVKV